MSTDGTNAGTPDAAEGVQALIDRLRDDGAERGRHQAEALLSEARAEAEQIRAEARAEAERQVAEATEEARRMRVATEEALKLAVRDTVLNLKNQIANRFTAHVEQLVSHTMADRELIGKMVLEFTRRGGAGITSEGDTPLEIVLPASVVPLEELRRSGGAVGIEADQGAIARLVLGTAGEVLSEGITLSTGDHHGGIRVRRQGDELEIDLTDADVARALSSHLLPRYRALLEGLIKG